MTRGRRITLAAAAAATAAAALWWWSADHPTAPRPGLAGLAAGEQRAFELIWDGTSVADASGLPGGASAYTGEVHVAARLVVRGLGRDGDATLVGYRLEDVTRAHYTVLGQDVLAGVDATVGELIALLDADGGLRELRPDPDAAPAADVLLRAIAQQSAVTVAAGDGWDAVEPGPTGVARMRYQRGARGALTRTRTGYTSLAAMPGACDACDEDLDGRATITLDGDGRLRELVDVERLVVVEDGAARLSVDNRFTLRASTRAARARPRPDLAGRRTVPGTGELATADDTGRAAGWSLDRIGQTVIRFVASGATPGEPAWMHGIAAYLRLHPEACGELLRLFTAPGLPLAGREMIASMLSAAGTPEAQGALRDGVDWMNGRYPAADVVSVLTRVTLITEPTAETATWLAQLRRGDDLDPGVVSAATLALGAAIGGLTDPDEAARQVAALKDELAATDDPSARATLLGALGNAGRPEDADAITALVDDPALAVRHQVTTALRKLDDAIAVPPLTALAGDAEVPVRVAAITALGRRGLDAAAANQAVTTALAAGAHGDEQLALIELLVPHAHDPTVATTLRALAGMVTDPQLLALIRHALAD